MNRIIYILSLLFIVGCSHNAYTPQRVEVTRGHTLILHDTEVQMENAYEKAWLKYPDKIKKKGRGEYSGFIDYWLNELHCWGAWPEECILHEYKHLLTKYGLKVPNDEHFIYGEEKK